jgi:hypothetical protein
MPTLAGLDRGKDCATALALIAKLAIKQRTANSLAFSLLGASVRSSSFSIDTPPWKNPLAE